MRHRRHRSKLNRTVEHRTALMRNLANALLEHGVIETTEPKAKQLRQYIERVITIAKDGLGENADKHTATAKRRLAFSYLNNKDAVKRLFEIAPAYAGRAGGYTRVVRSARRMGDGAPMAYIELVERELPAEPEKKTAAKKSKRAPKAKAAASAAS